jgi:halocyanin-like protein
MDDDSSLTRREPSDPSGEGAGESADRSRATHDGGAMTRRNFLRAGGAGAGAAAVGASATASAQESNESGGNGSGGGGGGSSGPIDYGGWFSDVPYWGGAGSTEDMTGQSEVTITVGAEANDGLSYAPAAARIDEGATVIWEWTGEGGAHNVEAEEGADFASEIVAEEGHTFEWTANTTGVVPYFCNPHKGQGMKAALAIGSDLPTKQVSTGSAEPVVADSAKTLGIATLIAMVSTLGMAYFFLKYGGDYDQ